MPESLLLCLVIATSGISGAAIGVVLFERFKKRQISKELLLKLSKEMDSSEEGKDYSEEMQNYFARDARLLNRFRDAIRKTSKGGLGYQLDKDLPQLIDVVQLGINGGMTFESSFSAYVDGFDSKLAKRCRHASKLLLAGIESKEKVLEDLSLEIGTKSFKRFSDTVIRTLRYGSAMNSALDNLSRQIRNSIKADREEEVSKAPTKMLIPTGVFILPAMFILIAGPFLLEALQLF